jgi:SAM-dependent methyltransferase
MIAGTNGRMWIPLRHKLRCYPIPSIPIPPSRPGGLLLDIGCGWGRWMAASAAKGYLPVGIDVKLDAARATRQVLRELGWPGYVLVADLEYLPFAAETFDLVWSFSVIQHVHKKKARSCLDGIFRCLKPGGSCTLEFPNKYGPWNMVVRSRRTEDEEDLESWCVRYYSVGELEHLLASRFGNFQYWAHCYFGLGLLPVDLKWVPLRFRPIVLASLALTALSKAVPPLRRVADSVFCRAVKAGDAGRGTLASEGFADSVPDPNLAILPLLRCPKTLNRLELDAGGERLLNHEAGIAYPVVEGIPILLPERATPLS